MCLECSKETVVVPPPPAPMSIGSARSGNSVIERERLLLVRKRLQVKRQLLALDRVDAASKTAAVNPFRRTETDAGESLQLPLFRPSGIVTTGRGSLMGSKTPPLIVIEGAEGQVDVELRNEEGKDDLNALERRNLTLQLEEIEVEEKLLELDQQDQLYEQTNDPQRVENWEIEQQQEHCEEPITVKNTVPLDEVPMGRSTMAPGNVEQVANGGNGRGGVDGPGLFNSSIGHNATGENRHIEFPNPFLETTPISNEQAARRLGGIPKLPLLTGKSRAEWFS